MISDMECAGSSEMELIMAMNEGVSKEHNISLSDPYRVLTLLTVCPGSALEQDPDVEMGIKRIEDFPPESGVI